MSFSSNPPYWLLGCQSAFVFITSSKRTADFATLNLIVCEMNLSSFDAAP